MNRQSWRFSSVVRVGIPALLLAGAVLAASKPQKHHRPALTPQESGTVSRLQAISAVNSRVVWASGLDGTYTRTTDGGKTWIAQVVPGAETLQFRDVEGVSERVAYLLSAGVGTDSRIYKTEDGGSTWTLQFQNQDPNGFYDCFAFWSPDRGITMGDSVNGRFPVIRTLNGKTWRDIGDRLPPAQPGEAAFAASGTCAATFGRGRAWLGTGGAPEARILATTDNGQTWKAYGTPIVQGTPSSGVFTVAFRNPTHGVLGGGELAAPEDLSDNFARSQDGGKTWELTTGTPFPGAVYGLSYTGKSRRGDDDWDDDHGEEISQQDRHGRGHGDSENKTVVATGPGGTAWTPDEGDTWFLLEGVNNYWAVTFDNPNAGWLVGTDGRILKVSF